MTDFLMALKLLLIAARLVSRMPAVLSAHTSALKSSHSASMRGSDW